MLHRITIFVFICLLFTQCNFEIEGDVQHIYKLTSPDKQIEIYECLIESPMAFGSGRIETTILNSGENYNPRHAGNFNGYVILGWAGNDTLKVIKFHKKKENEIKIPTSKLHEVKKWGDFYIDIIHRTSYGGATNWFSFDSLYFKSDSVYFLQKDSLGIKDTLGLLKGQIRLAMNSDTVTVINGECYVEDYFAKVTEENELGYPYVVGNDYEITPRYKLEASIFNEQPITIEMDIKNYK